MEREGKTLQTLPDGHPRRLADARNAWRKMTRAQRLDFARWMTENTSPKVLREVALILVDSAVES